MASGLLVHVLRFANLGDCTNDGATSRHDKFVLVDDAVDGPFMANADMPELMLVRRTLHGKNGKYEYLHAVPVSQPTGGVGPMFGGNFIYTSDSRFPNKYPIPVHDRWEFEGSVG